MSEYDVRNISKTGEQYTASAKSSSNDRIANALSNGNVGNGQYKAEQQSDFKKNQKLLEDELKQHIGISEDTFYEYVEKHQGIKRDTIFNLPYDNFGRILTEFLDHVESELDSLAAVDGDVEDKIKAATNNGASFDLATEIVKQTAGEDTNAKDIKEITETSKMAVEKGLDAQTAVKVAQKVQEDKTVDKDDMIDKAKIAVDEGVDSQTAADLASKTQKPLLDIINAQLPKDAKKYNSISEIPKEELRKVVIKVVNETVPQQSDSDKDFAAKLAAFRCLLASLKDADEKDFKIVLDTFEEVMPELKNNNIKNLFCLIKNFKDNPEALQRWIESNDFKSVLMEGGFKPDEINKIILNVAGIIRQGNPDNMQDTMFKIMDNLEEYTSEKHYQQLSDKYKKDPNSLSKNEVQYVKDYEKYLSLKDKDEKDLSIEERKWLSDYSKNKLEEARNFDKTFAAAMATFDSKYLKDIKEVKPDAFEAVLNKYMEYAYNDSSIKVDVDFLNSITDGQFSKLYEEYKASVNSGSTMAESPKINESGIGYTTTSQSEYTEALNNVSTLAEQIYSDEAEPKFSVEKSVSSDKSSPLNPLQGITQKSASGNAKLFDVAWAKGLFDIDYLGENFNKVCTKGVRKVWDFLDRNKQNRMDFLQSWNNNKLSRESAVRYDMDKDEIADLGLSIGETQVLQNRYDQLHKHDVNKTDMA